VIYIQTDDAGALLRFTDTTNKVFGGQIVVAMEPPTSEPGAREGLINVRDFTVKGNGSARIESRLAAPNGAQSGVAFTALRGRVQPAERRTHGPQRSVSKDR